MLAVLFAIAPLALVSCQSTVVVKALDPNAAGSVRIDQCGVRCEAHEGRHAGSGGFYVLRRDACGNTAIIQQHG